ncbi:hypothetical protein Acr_00g0092750 [Actinidia rufa]|uniref:Uncharacterized protein n=1 Tax=Actinidia rufa TaxID=165716 RepID=A0A7J0DXX1_9ERIC|nr:hypothetical protein Acr_00g0092750 [Actinidia rufa]
MAAVTKSTVVKVKPTSQDGSSKPKFDPSLTKKKIIDSSTKRPVDLKPRSTPTATKIEVTHLQKTKCFLGFLDLLDLGDVYKCQDDVFLDESFDLICGFLC